MKRREFVKMMGALSVAGLGLDGARIFVSRKYEGSSPEGYFYRRETAGSPAGAAKDMLELMSDWALNGYERQGCIHVRNVQELPEGPEKACLQAFQVRSWLCIPMWHAGERLGFLALDTVASEKNWTDDDIAIARIRRIDSSGGNPSIRVWIVSPAGVEQNGGEFSPAPDDHLTAGPHCLVTVSSIGCVCGARGRPTVRAGIVPPAGIHKRDQTRSTPNDHL